ncbi:unnamed protein product, partial [Penicillium pancosmium]
VESTGMLSKLRLWKDMTGSCSCCSREEPRSTPKVESIGMLSKLHLMEDMIRSCSYCSKKEPRSTTKVESTGMLSNLRLSNSKDTIRLWKSSS